MTAAELAMDSSQILHAFSMAERLPIEAIKAAREQRTVVAPAFVQTVERFVAGDGSDAGALFFVFHLLGEWREKSAYRPLAALLRLPGDDIEAVLGDANPETTHRVMAAVFDGDPAPLCAIVRDPDADDLVRSRMCEALAMVTLRGEMPREQTAAFLRACFDDFAALHDDCIVWEGWQSAIAMLGLVELVPLVQEAFEREFIQPEWMSFAEFKDDLDRAVAGEPSPDVQARREFELFGDTVEELSTWANVADRQDDAADEEGEEAGGPWQPHEPAVNPYRNVGRNDPCPCGSGKKFKKCCLDKIEAQQREAAAASRFRADADVDGSFDDDEESFIAITRYDPLVAPDPDQWLALDEGEQLVLVKDWHRRARIKLPKADLHAVIHVVVENQVAEGDALPVRRKLDQLMDGGLDRHEAVHAIGSVLAIHLNEIMRDPSSEDGSHDAYFAALEAITEESWRRDLG